MDDIHELFRKVREHPDFIGGTIFTTGDIPEDHRLPDDWNQWRLTDRLVERGNEVLVQLCVEEEGA